MNKTRKFTAAFLLPICMCVISYASSSAIKVKLDASQWDQPRLLEKLNEHGKSKGLSFESADKAFDYLIVYKSEQNSRLASGTSHNKSAGSVSVYDQDNHEVFSFERDNRNTDSGAMNAVAKEIVKRLATIRAKK